MKLRPSLLTSLLAAAAFGLARALVTRGHIGPFEYVASTALLCVLVLGAIRFARQTKRPRRA